MDNHRQKRAHVQMSWECCYQGHHGRSYMNRDQTYAPSPQGLTDLALGPQ